MAYVKNTKTFCFAFLPSRYRIWYVVTLDSQTGVCRYRVVRIRKVGMIFRLQVLLIAFSGVTPGRIVIDMISTEVDVDAILELDIISYSHPTAARFQLYGHVVMHTPIDVRLLTIEIISKTRGGIQS